MPSLAAWFRRLAGAGDAPETLAVPAVAGGIALPVNKGQRSRAPFAVTMRTTWGAPWDRRRSSRMLRHFAHTNEWIRVAIDRRKQQISQANWHIARIDDPNEKPDPRVVKAVGELFRYVNPKRESLRSLLDQVLEDLLVLDAGVIEIDKALGGAIKGLFAVDGATIAPDPNWDGTDQKAVRYRQYIDDNVYASWRNDEMIYMMASPMTTSSIGWSKVETLIRIIEAELYGEDFDYDMLRQTAPAGVLQVGGLPDAQVKEFRAYYDEEIAGSRDIAIIGDGGDGEGELKFVSFTRSPAEMQRAEYKKWLATKIAAVFQMDLGVFNLTEQIHKSIGEKQERLTDDGHIALAKLVEEYFTREIVWQFDENHAFRFSDLNDHDAITRGKLDEQYIRIGALTPNEIRARAGFKPVEWGDNPWAMAKGMGPIPKEPPEAQVTDSETEDAPDEVEEIEGDEPSDDTK